MPNINLIANRIYTKKLNLDLTQLTTSCMDFHKILEEHFFGGHRSYPEISAESTQYLFQYNMLMYPFPGFHNIYNEIKTMFYECLKLSNQESQKQYYIECWLNVYNPTDYIDWHSHCKPEHNTWFGIYCINVEPSKTTFDFPDVDGYIDVHGTNNLLVMLKGDENLHRTWPWEYPTPRITVAFNIVPNDSIDTAQRLNHWIPI